MTVSKRNAKISCYHYLYINSRRIHKETVHRAIEELSPLLSYREAIDLSKKAKSLKDWRELCEDRVIENNKKLTS